MVLEDIQDSGHDFASGEVAPTDGLESKPTWLVPEILLSTRHVLHDTSATFAKETVQLSYRIDQGPFRQHQIRFDKMPLPGFIHYIAFGGRSRSIYTSLVALQTIGSMESLLGRPLSQPEAEGTMLSVSLRRIYDWAGLYGGLIVGSALAFRRRKTFKFPLRSAKPVERYDSYPLRRLPLVTGRRAQLLWHGNRWLVYTALSWLALIPYCTYLGETIQAMHMQRDQRTYNVFAEYKELLRRQVEERREGVRKMAVRETGVMQHDSSISSTDEANQRGLFGDGGGDDDSPSSTGSSYSNTMSGANVRSGTQFRSRSSTRQGASRESSDPPDSNPFGSATDEFSSGTFETYDNPSNDPSSTSAPFLSTYDDASPASTDFTTTKAITRSTTGSSWAQLREAANTNTNTSPESSHFPNSRSHTDQSSNKRGILPPAVRQAHAQSAVLVRQQQQQQSNDVDTETPTDENSFSFATSSQRESQASQGRAQQRGRQQDQAQSHVQAQREFDERMESERRMGGGGGNSTNTGPGFKYDFNDGSNAAAASGGGVGDGGFQDSAGESAWEKRRRRGRGAD